MNKLVMAVIAGSFLVATSMMAWADPVKPGAPTTLLLTCVPMEAAPSTGLEYSLEIVEHAVSPEYSVMGGALLSSSVGPTGQRTVVGHQELKIEEQTATAVQMTTVDGLYALVYLDKSKMTANVRLDCGGGMLTCKESK